MILYKTSTPNSGNSNNAWNVNSDGNVNNNNNAYNANGAVPALYIVGSTRLRLSMTVL